MFNEDGRICLMTIMWVVSVIWGLSLITWLAVYQTEAFWPHIFDAFGALGILIAGPKYLMSMTKKRKGR